MKALGILGNLLLKNHMVRCLRATEVLLLLPRGAHKAVLSKGVLNEWAGPFSGFTDKNMHTLSHNTLRHSAHRSNFSEKRQQLCTVPGYHPKLIATQSGMGKETPFTANNGSSLDFS